MSASEKMTSWVRNCDLPKTPEVHFFGPDIGIEALAPIFIQHQCVGVTDNGAQAIIDEIASDYKAQGKSDQGNDGDPFLPWVFLCLPRMVDIALPHPPRAEVLLILLLMVDVNGR